MFMVARTVSNAESHNTLILRTFGKISFILYSEAGLETLPDRAFRIEGCDIQIAGSTDENGIFEQALAPYGDYLLSFGDAEFVIPSIPEDESPHPVHVPCELLPELAEWSGPLDEDNELEPLPEDESREQQTEGTATE